MIAQAIAALTAYAREKGLMEAADCVYISNRLIKTLGLCAPPTTESTARDMPLERILQIMTGHAIDAGIIGEGAAAREQLEAEIMGLLTPLPSAVQLCFSEAYARAPEAATEYFYTLCRDVNYIRVYRTALDQRWQTYTQYGALDITINLAKPEKDPRDIAAARSQPPAGYPACLLCAQNEGYAGRVDHPARQNLRLIPIEIDGEAWAFQYSPYVYYNEHCIVLNQRHEPMVIDRAAFAKLLDFVRQFPHYFVGSNADLLIVGGSILSHEHFQGGRYSFAMDKARVEQGFVIPGFEDVCSGLPRWPLSVIRLCHARPEPLIDLAAHILDAWRDYSDPQVDILARTGNTPHNTITPIARMRDGCYELDLVLRNNRASEEHPLGIFHPHAQFHHIKKENIGLIEVMGLAVLPARLLEEMKLLKEALLSGADLRQDERIRKHADWAEAWHTRPALTDDNIDARIQHEIGKVFEKVLEHAGVFKRDKAGKEAFRRFLQTL